MNKETRGRLQRMTGIAVFSAVVVVLTLLGNVIRFGPFAITLALAPIIIGAAVYGDKAGAVLGFVMGLTVFINGIATGDFAVMTLLTQNAVACFLTCVVKSTVAGWLSGRVYGRIAEKSPLAGTVTAGILCPVVNTGIFVLCMALFYLPVLENWAGGEGVLYYVIFIMTGLNFLIELGVNLILSSAITRVIRAGKAGHYAAGA